MLTRRPFLATILLVVVVRAVFVITFPLNDEGGDTSAYFTMIRTWTSSLVLAGGYPFIIGWPFTIDAIGGQVLDHPNRLAQTVLVMQHAIDFGLLLFFATVCFRAFGQAVACLVLVLYVLHPIGLGPVSSVYPEWLQAGLFISACSLGLLALHVLRPSLKVLLYAAAATLLTLSCLTKFNAVFAAPPVLLAAVVAEKKFRLRKVAIGLAAATTAATSLVLTFERAYHVPSTGTWRLTYDSSWVMMAKLNEVFDGKLPTAAGIWSKRWMALAGVLPPSYWFAGPQMFNNVAAVPDEIRAKYRPVFRQIVDASETELDQLQHKYPPPPTFNLVLSSVPVSYYVGLKESDELGTKVFLESLRAHPGGIRPLFAEATSDLLENGVLSVRADRRHW